MRLLAVGDRQPPWVDAAFSEYLKRLPREWRFRLDRISTAPRRKGTTVAEAIHDEGTRLLAKTKAAECVIVLDGRGNEWSTRELAAKIDAWQSDGRDLVFVIGGPDGLSDDCLERADTCWSLSRLTLPHGLVRVLLAEQLYRAWSLLGGHPYHRE